MYGRLLALSSLLHLASALSPNTEQCCAPVASASQVSSITPAFSEVPKTRNCIYSFWISVWQRCQATESNGALENLVMVDSIQDSRTKDVTRFTEGFGEYYALSFKERKIITQKIPIGSSHNIAIYEDSAGGKVSFGYDFKTTSNGGFESACAFAIDSDPPQDCGYCHDLKWNSTTLLNCFDPSNVHTSRTATATCEFSC